MQCLFPDRSVATPEHSKACPRLCFGAAITVCHPDSWLLRFELLPAMSLASMADENSSYLANRATTAVTRHTTNREAEAQKDKSIVESPSEDDVGVDEESDNASTSSQDAAPQADLEPYIFSSEETRRAFVVEVAVRSQSHHRPAFTFHGYAVKYMKGDQTAQDSGDASHRSYGLPSARGGTTNRARVRVFASNLILKIAYEPPSPKFSNQAPGTASYRLKLSDATGFKYTVRGLPTELTANNSRKTVVWGVLELHFATLPKLKQFTANIRHVKVLDHDSVTQSLSESAAAKPQSQHSAVPVPIQKPVDAQSSFGSPLSSPRPSQAKPGPASGNADAMASRDSTEQEGASKIAAPDFNYPGPAETVAAFLNDKWPWIGISVAALSLFSLVAIRSN